MPSKRLSQSTKGTLCGVVPGAEVILLVVTHVPKLALVEKGSMVGQLGGNGGLNTMVASEKTKLKLLSKLSLPLPAWAK